MSVPWLTLAVLLPGLAGVLLLRSSLAARARVVAVVVCSAVLFAAVAAARAQGTDPWLPLLAVDALSALLLPFVALLCAMLVLAAPRAWASPGALGRLLINESILMAAFAVSDLRWLGVLWIASYAPVVHALYTDDADRRVARVFLLYAGASSAAFTTGLLLMGPHPLADSASWSFFVWQDLAQPSVAGVALVLTAVLLRKASLPFHSWLPAVFDVRPTGPVLLLIAPMLGAYSLVRVALPMMRSVLGEHVFVLGPLSLLTAAYAAGLGLVQQDLRRLCAWLAVSQSALVLVGLECAQGDGLTGGVVVWLSAGLSLTGLGIAAWLIESRHGRLSLERHHGLYRRSPLLALVFLLCGLSLVGFPGMVGFVGGDLLLRAVLESFPLAGVLLFVTTAANGFSILRAFFRVFYGAPQAGGVVDLLPRERVALLVPLVLVLWQGLHPAPLVNAGAEAARVILLRTR